MQAAVTIICFRRDICDTSDTVTPRVCAGRRALTHAAPRLDHASSAHWGTAQGTPRALIYLCMWIMFKSVTSRESLSMYFLLLSPCSVCFWVRAVSASESVQCLLLSPCNVCFWVRAVSASESVQCLLLSPCSVCFWVRAVSASESVQCLLLSPCSVCFWIRAVSASESMPLMLCKQEYVFSNAPTRHFLPSWFYRLKIKNSNALDCVLVTRRRVVVVVTIIILSIENTKSHAQKCVFSDVVVVAVAGCGCRWRRHPHLHRHWERGGPDRWLGPCTHFVTCI